MGGNNFDVVVTAIQAGPGATTGAVTFVTAPVEGSNALQSSFQLNLPVEALGAYQVGQAYVLSLSPVTL